MVSVDVVRYTFIPIGILNMQSSLGLRLHIYIYKHMLVVLPVKIKRGPNWKEDDGGKNRSERASTPLSFFFVNEEKGFASINEPSWS